MFSTLYLFLSYFLSVVEIHHSILLKMFWFCHLFSALPCSTFKKITCIKNVLKSICHPSLFVSYTKLKSIFSLTPLSWTDFLHTKSIRECPGQRYHASLLIVLSLRIFIRIECLFGLLSGRLPKWADLLYHTLVRSPWTSQIWESRVGKISQDIIIDQIIQALKNALL